MRTSCSRATCIMVCPGWASIFFPLRVMFTVITTSLLFRSREIRCEILHGRAHRDGHGLAQGAEGSQQHVVGERLELGDVTFHAFSGGYAAQDLHRSVGADAAGRTFSTGLGG